MLSEQHRLAPQANSNNVGSAVAGYVGDKRWYVARTHPHAEQRAAFHLKRQGHHVFYPRVYKTIRHARRVARVLAPLFPNYLFISLDVSRERWRNVNGTFGVISLIMQGDAPQPAPRGIVEDIRSRTDVDGVMNWKSSLTSGQTIRICDGPFTDTVGVLECLDACGRVRVLLDLLGRSVSVTLRCEAITTLA